MALNQIFNQAASLTIYAVIKHKYISIISTEWPHLIGSVSASSLCDWKENACKPLSRQVLLRHFQHTSVFIQPWCAGKILQQSTELQPWLPLNITWLHECERARERERKDRKENHFRSVLRLWCSVTTETTNLCTLERKTWKEERWRQKPRRWVKAGCW